MTYFMLTIVRYILSYNFILNQVGVDIQQYASNTMQNVKSTKVAGYNLDGKESSLSDPYMLSTGI